MQSDQVTRHSDLIGIISCTAHWSSSLTSTREKMPKMCSGVLQRPSGKWDSIAPALWEPMLGDVSQCGKIETVHDLGQRILFL